MRVSISRLIAIGMVSGLLAMPGIGMPSPSFAATGETILSDIYKDISMGVVRINVVKKSYNEIVAEEREKKENGEDFWLPPDERRKDDNDDEDEKEDPNEPKHDWEKQRRNKATGTGFFVSHDGLIVTNEHVVRDGMRFIVVLNDDRRLPATLVGKDFLTDLAVLKVDMPDGVTPLKWGSAHASAIGDEVFAVGYPYGFDQSLTTGVISGKQRELSKGQYNPYIQTDTAVNKGNSGGPLLSMDGKVIGVNSALYTRSGGNEGLAFSIPSEHAQGIIKLLIADGEIKRSWFGIGYSEVKKGMGKLLGMDRDEGMLIARAPDDEPAYKAGIRAGDVIVAVNGESVKSRMSFRMQAAMVKGETTVTVWRHNGYRSFTLIPDDMDEAKSRRRAQEREKLGIGDNKKDDGRMEIMGMDLVPANEKAWKKLELPVGTTGLVVDRMETMSQASRAGFDKGDFITQVNDTSMVTPEDFEKIMQAALDENAQYVLVRYVRKGEDRVRMMDVLEMINLEAY
ncbi:MULTISPECIES: trypsin-like peptidase domain-containing protein [Thalassospira]|uniref:Trypsin-like peptidase domain-containing protein n=1 Tax=Thalassospira aquimaris TaxID=3037796 RepID=A0ABT6GDC3_9PROT|nr:MULTISPECIES: trypsin-like peptidase domain-containing protein [Thalassospira]MDG4720004.1 trypsin-like peptidase domain-containing protein [Thalassospira sp. FZY0004]